MSVLRCSAVLMNVLALAGCARQSDSSVAAHERVRAALDSVVRPAQEAYHAEHGRYASDGAALKQVSLPAGVRVFIRGADEHGWSASATHTDYPVSPCVLNVGEPPISAALRTGSASRPGRISPAGEVQCADPAQ